MAITVDAAATSLNRHHLVYDKAIHTTLKQGMEIEQYLQSVSCKHTYTAASAETTGLLQAYQCDFTPNLGLDFTAIDNTLERVKVDIEFTCDDLDQFYDTWMCDWAEFGKPAKDKSFPMWVYSQKVIPQLEEDLATAYWSGVRVAPTAGVAGTVAGSMTGLEKRVQDAVAAGMVTPIPTGVLNPLTIVAQVEAFCDAIPHPYRKRKGIILMSSTNATRYWRDYRSQFGTGNGVGNNSNEGLDIDATNKKVVGLAAMEGSDAMIFLPDNLAGGIWGRRTGEAYLPRLRWQEFDRKLKGMTEFHRFVGFKYWGHVFVNDQF